MALFISFEGGEGSGKSTQARLLRNRLVRMGQPVTLVREPGGTATGEQVRRWLQGTKPLTPVAELLLFAAARAELVQAILFPDLREGQVVICDRYADSTVAYQGCGRGIDLDVIHRLNALATQGLTPNLTVFLDVAAEEGFRRKGPKRGGRFEEENLDFHRRVRRGYLAMAAAEPERWLVIDGTPPRQEVARTVWGKVKGMLWQR